MESLDYYDILPQGMDAYLASHGHHFSKPMLEWAVSMMRNHKDEKVKLIDRKALEEKMAAYGISLNRNEGYYDAVYVWCMVAADYLGSSVPDEMHQALYVKDYVDDPDGNPTRAFDEFYINTIRKGIDIPWADMI